MLDKQMTCNDCGKDFQLQKRVESQITCQCPFCSNIIPIYRESPLENHQSQAKDLNLDGHTLFDSQYESFEVEPELPSHCPKCQEALLGESKCNWCGVVVEKALNHELPLDYTDRSKITHVEIDRINNLRLAAKTLSKMPANQSAHDIFLKTVYQTKLYRQGRKLLHEIQENSDSKLDKLFHKSNLAIEAARTSQHFESAIWSPRTLIHDLNQNHRGWSWGRQLIFFTGSMIATFWTLFFVFA